MHEIQNVSVQTRRKTTVEVGELISSAPIALFPTSVDLFGESN